MAVHRNAINARLQSAAGVVIGDVEDPVGAVSGAF
jgi:hypothetical protein